MKWLMAVDEAARTRAEGDPDADTALDALVAAARAAWPGSTVTADEIIARATKSLPEGAFADIVRALCAPDLLVACACAKGDKGALAHLSQLVCRETAAAHARIRPTLSVEDAQQLVTAHLLVGDAPKLERYGAQGSLAAWVRVVATRLLINVSQRAPREKAIEQKILDAVIDEGGDPELAYLKRTYRDELTRAFSMAARSIDARDRALLRYALVEELTVDEIGAIYGVHRATAARWVSAAREALEGAVRTELSTRLRIDGKELQSIVRLVRSQLDLSLTRMLATERS